MELQKLYSYTRQAIDKYNMINDGDKIAIGVSLVAKTVSHYYML